MAESLDLQKVFGDQDLAARRVGFRDGQLRIILYEKSSGVSKFTIILEDVHSFFDHGLLGGPILAALCEKGVGSFGWWMTPRELKEYSEFHLTGKQDTTRNLFMAIAREVTCRPYRAEEDLNYPG